MSTLKAQYRYSYYQFCHFRLLAIGVQTLGSHLIPIEHIYTQLNDQVVLFQVIQFSISHLFVLSLNVKKFYLTHS